MLKYSLLLTLALFLGMAGHYVFDTVRELHQFSHVAELSAAEAAELEEGPLLSTKHLEALHSQTLKTEADKLRRSYNRTYHICALLRAHKDSFVRYRVITRSAAANVEKNLAILEQHNKEVEKQFEKYIEYAQETYGAECARYNSPTEEDRATYLSKGSDKLLQKVELPISFK